MIIDGNFYIGDSSVSRLYQGANLVYDSSHPDILLQYIANGPDDGTGTPNVYFDTGFTPQLSTKTEIKFETASVAAGRLFGCGNATNGATQYWFNMYASGNTQEGTANTSFKFAYRGQDIAASITPEANTQYTVTLFGTYSGNAASEVKMVVNGTTYSRTRSITSNISSASSAYIFAAHGSSPEGPNSNSGVKVYHLKMWSDNNLVRFYIPVLHYTNGQYTPCFYDKVNDTYIYNLGTDDVAYKISGDYLVDYFTTPVKQTNAVVFDTGVNIQSNISMYAKIRAVEEVNASTLGQQLFVGKRKSGSFKLGLYAPISGNSDPTTTPRIGFFTLDSSVAAATRNLQDISWGTDYTFSTTCDSSNRILYVDSTKYSVALDGQNILLDDTYYIFGDSTQGVQPGSRIYYTCISDNTTIKSFIPVLHNSQAAFLDLNSGTYIYNIGTDTPYYILKS